MITTLLLVGLAHADACKFQAAEFKFVSLPDRNRAVEFKGGEKVPFPGGASGLAVNMVHVSGDGSVCQTSGAYPVGPNKVAVLFERLDAGATNTYAAVLDVKERAFAGEPVLLAPSTGLGIKKTAKGFSFADFRPMGKAEALVSGSGAATGLEMVLQQTDLWKTVELGPKGLTVKLDKNLTWENSRWKKYFAKRSDFEKALRLDQDPAKTLLYFAFSREKKKDCILVDHAGEKKAYCTAVTAANRPGDE